ncbi:hypothetical protein, partial [Lysobacter sp. 1R34A]|uniref:hypothetical protein n=1 Tax=Lysobacter sp. 1R34A TaxID=3445786 RepID=UPI003EEDE6E8
MTLMLMLMLMLIFDFARLSDTPQDRYDDVAACAAPTLPEHVASTNDGGLAVSARPAVATHAAPTGDTPKDEA